ncbi:MAG: hypothetical protein DCC68_25630 [Planctomycetota bacterium]|nr:MAG: hypothetical protein DCC68_25630 [Planctomycetota bacterium]
MTKMLLRVVRFARMMNKSFNIEIQGDGVAPETVRVSDLFAVLRSFGIAIEATARASATDDVDADLFLVNVDRGSNVLTLKTDDAGYVAAVACATAIKNRDFTGLPSKARESLDAIWHTARKRQWSAVVIKNGSGMPEAAIRPDSELLSSSIIRGMTSLVANIDRVGGTNPPTAKLIFLNGDSLTVPVADVELSSRLGKSLYHTVSVEGEASWDSRTWRLVDFKITEIGPYNEDADILETLGGLAVAAAGRWDDIDPDEYIRQLRSDD